MANLYRWEADPKVHSRRPKTVRANKWTPELKKAIKKVRDKRPTWGKLKIHARLLEDGFEVSVSTVGRIISDFIERGIVRAYDQLISGKKHRVKRRRPRRHATLLPKGHKPKSVGELIQIDSVHVGFSNGRKIYHINGICPISRYCWGMAFEDHGAKSASIFLEKMLEKMPFKVQAIQTDQGSEFRGDFEDVVKAFGLEFYYLPPKSPKLNPHVERVNRTWREDFFQMNEFNNHTIEQINHLIDVYAQDYNSQRYHQSLGMKTPLAYLKTVCNIG